MRDFAVPTISSQVNAHGADPNQTKLFVLAFLFQIEFGRCPVLQRLMQTSPVVEIEVAVQRLSQLMAVALYLICR